MCNVHGDISIFVRCVIECGQQERYSIVWEGYSREGVLIGWVGHSREGVANG